MVEDRGIERDDWSPRSGIERGEVREQEASRHQVRREWFCYNREGNQRILME